MNISYAGSQSVKQPFNCLVQNRHAVHEEVNGSDILGQHGRWFVLLRHTHRPLWRPYLICTSRSGKRLTPARRQLSQTQLFLGGSFQRGGGWCAESVGCLPAPHSIGDPPSAPHMLLLDKLMSCRLADTNGCLDFRCHAFALSGQMSAEWSRCLGSRLHGTTC